MNPIDEEDLSELTSGSTTPASTDSSFDDGESSKYCTGILYSEEGQLISIEMYFNDNTDMWHVDDIESVDVDMTVYLLDTDVGETFHPTIHIVNGQYHQILARLIDQSINKITEHQLLNLIRNTSGPKCWTVQNVDNGTITQYVQLLSMDNLTTTIRVQ